MLQSGCSLIFVFSLCPFEIKEAEVHVQLGGTNVIGTQALHTANHGCFVEVHRLLPFVLLNQKLRHQTVKSNMQGMR